MLPQHDKFCTSLGNSTDHNGLGMFIRVCRVCRIGMGKTLGQRPLGRPGKRWKDDSRTCLTKIVRMGGGWNWVMFMSNSILGIISIELMGYAPILLCTQVHASHITVQLYSIALPH